MITILSFLLILIAPAPVAAAQESCGETVTVQPGDTLNEIAGVCNTTVEAILEANSDISNRNVIYVGQVLNMPEPEETDATTYVVQRGDKLFEIANQFGTTIFAIMAANPDIVSPSLIYAGQRLIIPDGDVAVFERTNIYLIALEDAGQRGPEIGCDDSVVPVEVEIESTVAPLTAALEQLLALDEEFYGESGLYNALYRSDLRVEDVRISGGEAIIRLTGEISVGGVCDEPRVEAQLRHTALQYDTIDRVEILINGQVLDEFF